MGVARALEQLPSHMTPEETMKLLEFTIPGTTLFLATPLPHLISKNSTQ